MLPRQVEEFLGKKKSSEKDFVYNIITVMREFHLSVEEMERMKLPTFATLLDYLDKERKKEDKNMEKMKHRGKR